ncbi:hypothetical protein HFO86_34685 [Rhizobium leguminosarum]|uniref:hypothetical protein n=1 Tax=Rhizobium leguminosarum TaxID=384 RepID=UPI001C94D7DE|nr:hypothetical protein [Rhizobium leguminosarum]MBY5475293.1 hypothetical protein [Rhizobium leguminosarum]
MSDEAARTKEYLENRYGPSNFWVSSLDLLGRQPLLRNPMDMLGDRGAEGVPVRLPNGKVIENPFTWSGYVVGPASANLAKVAEAGRALGNNFSEMLSNPYADEGASLYLATGLGAYVGQGGKFDYQREGSFLTGYTPHRHFRDISNVNVGLLAQQAGLTLEETLSISENFARVFSSNARPSEPYSLDPRTKYFIEVGFQIGVSGVYNRPR